MSFDAFRHFPPVKEFLKNWQIARCQDGVCAIAACLLTHADAVQLAMFGYGAQAVITGEGPFKNLTDHLSKPAAYNILTNFGHPAL